MVVRRVAFPRYPQLVVPNLGPRIVISWRNEMVVLVKAAIPRERQNALLGNQVIEFEFAELHVEPGTVSKIVETNPDRLKVERSGFIRGRNQKE